MGIDNILLAYALGQSGWFLFVLSVQVLMTSSKHGSSLRLDSRKKSTIRGGDLYRETDIVSF